MNAVLTIGRVLCGAALVCLSIALFLDGLSWGLSSLLFSAGGFIVLWPFGRNAPSQGAGDDGKRFRSALVGGAVILVGVILLNVTGPAFGGTTLAAVLLAASLTIIALGVTVVCWPLLTGPPGGRDVK